jgi:hypothetical protein
LPEVATFNQFIFNLLHNNGDLVAAQHVYHVEMPEAGVEPNDRTIKTMARAEELANMGNTTRS